ncbi:MAG: hypothetical protein QOH06_3071 [Acidobacteriota bacterium]|jgi:hypothetical protein|nr:hypothetical protein [Acidobacteriota bacterium]
MALQSRSFADFITYWNRLLQATMVNLGILPDLRGLPEMLQGVLDELNVVAAQQDAHRAGLQTETQRLQVLMVRGRDISMQLRSLIVSHLGPRNPKLAEFRMRFLGKPRALRKDEPELPEAPAPAEKA